MTDTSIIYERSNSTIIKHNVIQPTYTEAKALRCHSGANEFGTTLKCVAVYSRVWGSLY